MEAEMEKMRIQMEKLTELIGKLEQTGE
jgi:hypothetical protein